MCAEGPLTTPTTCMIEQMDKHMAILVDLKKNEYTETDIYNRETGFYTQPSNLLL